MVEAHEDPFSRVMQKLNDSADEARKSWDENPQELHNSMQVYNDWAVFAFNLILKEVSDPMSKVKAFGDVLK